MSAPLTPEAVEAAFDWLTGSSEELAMAKAQLNRSEFKAKKVFSRLFLRCEGSIESRKAQATVHEEYEAAMETYFAAVEVWNRIEDQRDRAATIVDVWKSLQYNERTIVRSTR